MCPKQLPGLLKLPACLLPPQAEQLQRSRMHTRACTALTALESQLIGNGYGTGRHMSEPAAIVDDDSMQDPPSGAQLLQVCNFASSHAHASA